jgi:hypothetical protein
MCLISERGIYFRGHCYDVALIIDKKDELIDGTTMETKLAELGMPSYRTQKAFLHLPIDRPREFGKVTSDTLLTRSLDNTRRKCIMVSDSSAGPKSECVSGAVTHNPLCLIYSCSLGLGNENNLNDHDLLHRGEQRGSFDGRDIPDINHLVG